MSLSGDKHAHGRAALRKAVGEVVHGLETGGVPGLIKTVGRMIGQNQPSIECVREAEQPFGADAPSGGEDSAEIFGEESWDAALDFAACLRDAKLDPDPPEPPPPPPLPPPPPPPPPFPPPPQPDGRGTLADAVLAALLVRLHDESARRRR